MASSELQLKPGTALTQTAFDTDKSPSKYIGLKSPPQDPKDVANEVFGLCPSTENPATFYSPLNYGGPFIPLYTQQPGQFGMPYENFEQVANSSSSSSDASPATLYPQYPQYAMPMPFPYILGGQYPQMYNCSPYVYDAAQGKDNKLANVPPLSVKVLSSSEQVEKVETDGVSQRKNARGKHYNGDDYSCLCPGVSSLSSPLKRMKVVDNGVLMEGSTAEDSISAYFADVSANTTCSDDDAEENEEVSSIMSLLLKSKQDQHTKDARLHLAGLNHISAKEKEDLEQIAGTNDLTSLLNNAMAAKDTRRLSTDVQSPPPTSCNEVSSETKYIFNEDSCAGVSAMDMHNINAKVTSSQEDNYFLPSLDSLLNMGEDTIVTMKAAMNLDIQGVVEIATAEDSSKEFQLGNGAHSSADEIQIN